MSLKVGGQLSARPYSIAPSEDRTSAKRTHDAARRIATVFGKSHCLIRTSLPAGYQQEGESPAIKD